MKKQVIQTMPFNVNEVLFTNRIAKMLSMTTEAVPNKGNFSAIRVTSNEKFKRDEIGLILDKFNKRFNKHLRFEKSQEKNMFSIGYFTITKNID